jgi:O-antigen/teichoic acid export membrane protein
MRGGLQGAGLAVVDQGVSSISNVAITVLVARVADAPTFGVFALVYASVVLLQGSADGLIGEPFAVLHSDSAPDEARRGLRQAAGAAVAVGGAIAAGLALVGAALPEPARSLLLCYALLAPALLVQSLWRFACFALRRPGTAVANDLVWMAVQVAALGVVIAAGAATPASLVLAWGTGAVAAAVVGFVQLGIGPDLAGGGAWLRQTSHLGVRYAAEFFSTFGANQAALTATGWIAGLAAVAQLRGAQLLFGPVMILATSVRVAGTPIAVRQKARGARHLRAVTVCVGAGMAVAILAWTSLILLAPAGVGESVEGASWVLARAAVPMVAVSTICAGVAIGLVLSLRALADARRSLRGRMAQGALRLVGAATGAALAGGVGAATGLAVGAVLGLGVLGVEYRASIRELLPG